MSNTSPSAFIGTASSATTDGLTPPSYGLAYDLGTGSWKNAAQFQQFARDVLPLTQQKAQEQAKALQAQSLHSQELQRAQNYQSNGFFATADELGTNKTGIGNQIMTGFKGLWTLGKQALSQPSRDAKDLPSDAYQQYTKSGGLLTQDEFNSFSTDTQKMLLTKAKNTKDMHDTLAAPGVKQIAEGLGYAYRGTTTGVEMLGSNPMTWATGSGWHKAWTEAQGESLGNALVNLALDPFYSREQLDRMKRDNPWYQMTSFGTELGATWFIDPVTVAGKGVGAAARFKTMQFPIDETSSYAIALRQATKGEKVTTVNPLAKGYAAVQAKRMAVQWDHIDAYAQQTTPAEFAQLPMFKQRYRAVDGGAASYALHWAANNKKWVQDATGIDAFDLTKRLTMGDPQAYAMLRKLQEVPPSELQQIAPDAGSLLDSLDALKTKADVFQSEIDDLNKYADSLGDAAPGTPTWEHRWEIHTDVQKRQEQLSQVQDALARYAGTDEHLGYQDWLDLTTGPKGLPLAGLHRVQGPSRARWSQVRNLPGDGAVEQRSLYQPNQFGPAHSFQRITKPLFIKRANTVEIDGGLDSGLMSINRQFDQYEHMFGYAPEGARQDALARYVKAASPFDRYKVLHDLEDEHLITAVAQRFNVEPDFARTVINKIHDERAATINGILSGEGAVYRSAPTLGERAASGTDSTLQLVSRDDTSGMARLKLMQGNHIQEFDVPTAALEPRVKPEDVTQTPNYYNPLDVRRLYHEFKHNDAVMQELNANWLHIARGDAVASAQAFGEKFNSFWKPVQLFRLGWPMRVLMDEGARATAIFGPMYWLTGAGKDAVTLSGRNIVPNVANYIERKRKGPLGTEMGPGPVTTVEKQAPNQFLRDAEVNQAVQVPQELWDPIVPDRLTRISQRVNAGPSPEHPMWSMRGQDGQITVYDPVTGRAERTGRYVVPIRTSDVPSTATPEQLLGWYRNNAELLSRRGMRVVVADGRISVGRVYGSDGFTRAHQFAQYATEAHPDTRIWDMRSGKWSSIEDAPDTPMSQAAFWHDSETVPEGAFDSSDSMVRDGLHTAIPRDVTVTHGDRTYRIRNENGRRRTIFDLDREVTPAQRLELDNELSTTATGNTWRDVYSGLNRDQQAELTRLLQNRYGIGALTHSAGDSQVYVWLDPNLRVRAWNGASSYQSLADRFAHPASVEKPLWNQTVRAKRDALAAQHEKALAANKDLAAQEQSFLDPNLNLDAFDDATDNRLSGMFNQMRTRREQGAGWKQIKSSDGTKIAVPDAFEGHSGQLFRGLTSSNGALDVLSEGHGQGSSMFRRRAAAYRTYSSPQFTDKALDPKTPEGKRAVRYFQVYADTVNDHLGNSPIIQKMIAGQSNDQITNWLESSIEGQRILRDVKPKEVPTGVWVDDHRYKFDYYVPSKKLQRLLGKGRLQPSDFRKNIADEDLPNIYGPDLEVLDRRRGLGRFLSDWADKGWEYLGNKPIDAFSRHPFAAQMYRAKMRNLIASTNSDWLTPDMIDVYQQQAHKFALNETRRMLYNLTETTNFNDALRFIAPFWGAQYEAISKWLRIISDRPEMVGRFFGAQRAVYKNFKVVDPQNNNQEVTSGTRPGGLHGLGLYHPNDMVIMQMPKWIQKKFGMENIGSLGVPIGSANTVLQGDLPLLPSLGPLVTIPVDQFMRKTSDTYGVENDQSLLYRWMFPIGRPRSKDAANQMLDQFVPGWINRVRQANSPQDAMSRINMEMLVGREMVLRNRRLGKPDPTPTEITKAADHLWMIRIVSGLIQPFQTQYLPSHQYWLDAAHAYQKQYGQQWWDKFIDKYGEEAAIYATSSSNSIGVPPTDKGMEEWSKNKELIQKFSNWTSAIISPEAYMGQFSSDAYGQQFNITLGPGDTRTLRSGSSLQDRLYNEPEVQLGWREYRKVNAMIEAELAARGLTSVQQAGAEKLALIKQMAKADIAAKYPAWARAFQEQSNAVQADIEDLKKLAPNPIFDKRPDWQGVRQYLDIRNRVTAVLDANYASGRGSRSLQATENTPLRNWFYGQVGQLILDNPAFAEFYTRYLDQDTLTMGSGF